MTGDFHRYHVGERGNTAMLTAVKVVHPAGASVLEGSSPCSQL